MWRPVVALRSSRLSVLYDGKVVLNPHFSTVVIASKSRADISSASFDGSDDITFDAKLNLLAGSFQTEGEIDIREMPTGFAIPAQRIAKGSTVRISFLTEGKPSPPLAVRSSLIDIDVVRVTGSPEATRSKRLKYVLTATLPMALLSITLAVISILTITTSSR